MTTKQYLRQAYRVNEIVEREDKQCQTKGGILIDKHQEKKQYLTCNMAIDDYKRKMQ